MSGRRSTPVSEPAVDASSHAPRAAAATAESGSRSLPASIMVGVDGSALAREALRVAAGLARHAGGAVIAVHVVPPPSLSSFASPQAAQRAVEGSHHAGEAILADARSQAGTLAVGCELHSGDPADTLCRRAAELGVDLVVVGSRGLGRIDRLLLGSVSAAVAARAPCSVLIVRARGRLHRGTAAGT